MEMSDTPETDAKQKLKDIIGDEYVFVEFARKLERERDRYQNQADALVDHLGQTQERMIDAERQRDRLAAVLQKIRDGYGGQLAAPNCCEDCDFLLPIDEALQSLNRNK